MAIFIWWNVRDQWRWWKNWNKGGKKYFNQEDPAAPIMENVLVGDEAKKPRPKSDVFYSPASLKALHSVIHYMFRDQYGARF